MIQGPSSQLQHEQHILLWLSRCLCPPTLHQNIVSAEKIQERAQHKILMIIERKEEHDFISLHLCEHKSNGRWRIDLQSASQERVCCHQLRLGQLTRNCWYLHSNNLKHTLLCKAFTWAFRQTQNTQPCSLQNDCKEKPQRQWTYMNPRRTSG